APEQFFHRGYGFARAGYDPVVIAKISRDVKDKAVRSYPALYVNADRRDLSLRSVHAGEALDPECFDTEVRHRADQNFLKVANVSMNVLALQRERNDRVADDLADAVVSYAAAAIRLEDLDA